MESSHRPLELSPQDIRFTHAAVYRRFQDGRIVKDTISALMYGELKPTDIPPIRVVFHEHAWWTLDNRRLFAFRTAGIKSIPVVVMTSGWKPQFHRKLNRTRTRDEDITLDCASTAWLDADAITTEHDDLTHPLAEKKEKRTKQPQHHNTDGQEKEEAAPSQKEAKELNKKRNPRKTKKQAKQKGKKRYQ